MPGSKGLGGYLRSFSAASLLVVAVGLSACTNGQAPAGATESIITSSEGSRSTQDAEYRLGSGDKLKLQIYGEDDLSGEFEINGAGTLSLPLLGQTKVQGLTTTELEMLLTERLRTYVRSPQVTVQVLNYRPFYIQGEIKKGGEYPYSNGLLVRDAVAKAGGYTYRASTAYVYIRHAHETGERKYSLDESVKVLPGDSIRVPERFF
jgi:protein involved in polysaccharide export with SLBB domain